MKKLISLFLTVCMICMLFMVTGVGASAESKYPDKNINFLVAASAGGSMDVSLRILLPFLEEELGVKIGVQNIAGAGGWVCYADVLNKEADGYTITAYANSSFFHLYNPTENFEGDIADFTFLANAVSDPNALYTNKDSEIQTMEQFIEYCKTHKDILIGTSTAGADDHVAYLKLANVLPEGLVNTSALPATDGPESITNQLSGITDFLVGNVGDYKTVKDNMNMLCVLSEERSPLVPDVPTFNEVAEQMGLDGRCVAQTYRGYMMKAGADPVVLDRLIEAFEKTMANPEYQEKLLEMGFAPNIAIGEDAAAIIDNDINEFIEVVPLFTAAQ